MLLSIIFQRTLYVHCTYTGLFKISNFQSKLRQSQNPSQKWKEHLTKYELFMLKILESIRYCLWRDVNSCLTWLRTVRRDGRKCACLFFIHDMFGWKYTSPIFPYIPPLTRNCILMTHFRDYDQICWWHGLLRGVTSASPRGGFLVKKSLKIWYRPLSGF